MKIDRRQFVVGTTAAVSGLAAGQSALSASTAANDIRVAVIGVRSRGNEHLNSFGARVAAICDVDHKVLQSRADEHEARTSTRVDRITDYRKLLERDDIDCVSIATPNHTHSLIAIDAIRAGKHVYVEKPVSHNVWEGRQLVAAANKHGQIVQCGTQSRSSKALQQAVQWVQGGALGKIEYAIGTCYKPRKPVASRTSPLSIPDHIDYDLWCGPAAKEDLYRESLHYDWHWDWNTGNGDMGNQGIHQMDIARWFLGEDGLAPRTISIGGRLGYEDVGNTPNTQVVLHDYPDAPLLFETRGLPRSKEAQRNWGDSMDHYRGSRIGVIVQCERGHVLVPNYREAIAFDRDGENIKYWKNSGNHFENFLDAVQAQDASLLTGPIQEGHVSSALCHTGGVSQQLAEPATAREIAERIAGNDLLSDSFERMAGHLRANGVDVDESPGALAIGPMLQVDPATERFTDSDPAAGLFARKDRSGFEVPDYGA